MKIKISILFSLLLSITLTPNVLMAQESIYSSEITPKANNSYTAEQVVKELGDTVGLTNDDISNEEWVFITVNNTDFLNADNGTDFMDLLYPSGIRLSTMLLDPSDAFYNATDFSPIYYGEGATLLRIISNGRVNFHYSELKAAEKYYRLLQAKSIAMGLPVFSFKEEFSNNYSNELLTTFKTVVNSYEEKFGVIGFPDTTGLSFDWCNLVSTNYGIDLKNIINTSDILSDYRIPDDSGTISLYTNYNSNTLTDKQSMTVYDENNFNLNTVDNLDKYSYDIQQAYYMVCQYIPKILNIYDDVYSDVYVNTQSCVLSLEELLLTDSTKDKEGEDTTLNNLVNNTSKETKYDNDPFVQAIENKKVSTFSDEYAKSLEADNTNIKTTFHNICLIITLILIFALLINYIVSFFRKR